MRARRVLRLRSGCAAVRGRVQDNYLHGFAGGAEAHFDGIEINGGVDITILHNSVINEADQTAAIMLNNELGPLRNILVE